MSKFFASVIIAITTALFPAITGASQLNLITSSSIPPYVIADANRGIVITVMKEALAYSGYEVRFHYSTNKRVVAELQAGHVDGAYNFPSAKINGFYLSDAIIDYQNVVVTLAEKSIPVSSVNDLSQQRVVAFQNAPQFLGVPFGDMAKANPEYEEVAEQASQVRMLFWGRADAIVLDRRIYFYYLNQLAVDPRFRKPVAMHEIFPSAPRFAVFANESLRNQFNDGLKKLRLSGRYDEIVASYQ